MFNFDAENYSIRNLEREHGCLVGPASSRFSTMPQIDTFTTPRPCRWDVHNQMPMPVNFASPYFHRYNIFQIAHSPSESLSIVGSERFDYAV